MPNIKSAKKRMNLSARARLKNRSERARIRTAIKKVRAAETAEAAEASLRDAVALLDRAATRRLFHPNRVARVKGQLQAHVNGLAS
jgi:small subunit ribosomal protein S20